MDIHNPECGCEIKGTYDYGNLSYIIAFCPLHTAAPELLEALLGCHDALQELSSKGARWTRGSLTVSAPPPLPGPEHGSADIGGWLVDKTGNPSWANLEIIVNHFIEIQAAIAKAEGA